MNETNGHSKIVVRKLQKVVDNTMRGCKIRASLEGTEFIRRRSLKIDQAIRVGAD